VREEGRGKKKKGKEKKKRKKVKKEIIIHKLYCLNLY
jgi:hypothetical protein